MRLRPLSIGLVKSTSIKTLKASPHLVPSSLASQSAILHFTNGFSDLGSYNNNHAQPSLLNPKGRTIEVQARWYVQPSKDFRLNKKLSNNQGLPLSTFSLSFIISKLITNRLGARSSRIKRLPGLPNLLHGILNDFFINTLFFYHMSNQTEFTTPVAFQQPLLIGPNLIFFIFWKIKSLPSFL